MIHSSFVTVFNGLTRNCFQDNNSIRLLGRWRWTEIFLWKVFTNAFQRLFIKHVPFSVLIMYIIIYSMLIFVFSWFHWQVMRIIAVLIRVVSCRSHKLLNNASIYQKDWRKCFKKFIYFKNVVIGKSSYTRSKESTLFVRIWAKFCIYYLKMLFCLLKYFFYELSKKKLWIVENTQVELFWKFYLASKILIQIFIEKCGQIFWFFQ